MSQTIEETKEEHEPPTPHLEEPTVESTTEETSISLKFKNEEIQKYYDKLVESTKAQGKGRAFNEGKKDITIK